MSTTPNCGYIGGHAEGYDDSCAWCAAAAYVAKLNGGGEAAQLSTPPQLPAGVVAYADQGEAAASLALDRCMAVWHHHRQTKTRTATLLGTTVGLSEIAQHGDVETIIGMLAVAIMRMAETQAAPPEAVEPWHGKVQP